LTKALAEAIEMRNDGFHADSEVSLQRNDTKYGAIDILLTPEKKDSDTASTPLALLRLAVMAVNGGENWTRT
jgi:hypothetical protein